MDDTVVEDVINRIARAVIRAGMEAPAMLFFSSVKPLTMIGSMLGKAIVSPLVGLVGYDAMERTDLYLTIFESRGNVERLIKKIEELSSVTDHQEKQGKKEKKA